ncbi:MAG TPA: alginate lyase family protein [Puia sp.]
MEKMRFKFIKPTLLFLICFSLSKAEAQYISLSRKEADQLRKEVVVDRHAKFLFDSIRRVADAALGDDPNPIDTLRTEGLLQGDPRKAATWEAIQDFHKMYALAMVWRMTGQSAYFDKASVYLIAWADSNHSRGDPIDDTNLDPAIAAYDNIKEWLTPAEIRRIDRWLRQTAEAEIHAGYNRPERATARNNWNSHRLKIVGEIGFAIGDKALQHYAIDGIQEQIGRNLQADGRSEDFISRDALHYHVYDLEPLLRLAIVLQRATRKDYYHYLAPSGASLAKSVEWLLPYLDGRQTHAEFVNSTVEFDRRRAQNGEAGYKSGTLFEPKSGIATLVLASYFDEAKLPLAQRLAGSGEAYPNWQAVINALRR